MTSSYITVCIATYKRRQGLERLLRSLENQKGAAAFDIIVVDNDREKSGEAVALQFRDTLPLTYLVEPVRGIARTRNRAVAVARSRFLAFIDDDEWAAPQWLAALEHEQTRSTADVVIGRVEVEFDPEVSELVRGCGIFDPRSLLDGAPVPWYFTRTSNAYVRRDALPDRDAPFATCFDLIGGEDVHLFKTMIELGARIVASAAAVVFEYRPLARANFLWILRRALRNGGTMVELEWNATPAAARLRQALRCAGTGVAELARAGTVWSSDRRKAGRHVVRGGQQVGKLLYALGMRIEEYRQHR